MKCEHHRIRGSKLSEATIKEMAESLKLRYFTFTEVQRMAHKNGLNGGIETILSLFSVRGYLVTEKTVKTFHRKTKSYVKKSVYKILTDEDYEKWDEEAHKDAKRRLLAAISY